MPAKPLTPLQLFTARQTVELELSADVDLVDLSQASAVLRLEVVDGGKLLYEQAAEQSLAFEARVLGEYADLMEATREIRESIYNRGTVYAT